MRVIHVSDHYPPAIGGTELYVQTMAKGLAARGHEVHVLTHAVSDTTEIEVDDGVTIHRRPGTIGKYLSRLYERDDHPLLPPAPDPLFTRELSGLVRDICPDVIHAHGWSGYSVGALRGATARARLWTIHDHGLECAKRALLIGDSVCEGPALRKCLPCAAEHYGVPRGTAAVLGIRASSRLLSKFDAFVVVSEFMEARARHYVKGPAIELIRGFIPGDASDGSAEVPRPDFIPDEPFIMFVGALSRHKGVHILLEAHQQMRHDCQLLMLGTPEPGFTVGDAPRVVVRQQVPHEQVMYAWGAAAVGVVPSLWPEPFGQVAVESAARGTPVVASRIGGLQDIVVDGVTGVLVPPGDPQSLSAALDRVLADERLLASMGENARRRSREFSVAASVTSHEALYRRLVER